ncbi:hypothetical protein DFJ77DRAFT_442603 [Powellomyces hirtus]|nr:hypothetical protein DFJ77DRAFT_442603 [Powellomyces hirtus]
MCVRLASSKLKASLADRILFDALSSTCWGRSQKKARSLLLSSVMDDRLGMDSKLSLEDLGRAHDVSLTREAVQTSPATYFPLLFAIRLFFESGRDSWKKSLELRTIEEKKALARIDDRGGAIIKEFPLLPAFSDGWQPITMGRQGLDEGDDPQQIYRALWSKFFRVPDVLPSDAWGQTSYRTFHHMIRTHGVWLGVLVNTARSRKRLRASEPVSTIPGVTNSKASRLAATDPAVLLGKVVAVVDPMDYEVGHSEKEERDDREDCGFLKWQKPILTVGYYRIGSELGHNGERQTRHYRTHQIVANVFGKLPTNFNRHHLVNNTLYEVIGNLGCRVAIFESIAVIQVEEQHRDSFQWLSPPHPLECRQDLRGKSSTLSTLSGGNSKICCAPLRSPDGVPRLGTGRGRISTPGCSLLFKDRAHIPLARSVDDPKSRPKSRPNVNKQNKPI